MTAAGPAYDTANNTEGRLELIRRALPDKPGRALDLGAGTGWLSKELAGRGWSVVAVEANPQAARRCAAQGVRVENRTLSFKALAELLAEPWDLIAAINFLHHTADPRAILELMLGAHARMVVIQIPDRIEHANRSVIGNQYIAQLYDIALARAPSVLGWTSTNLEECARRPLLVWDAELIVGTVVAGGGHTTREWAKGGAMLAAELGLELTVGSLNLELAHTLDAALNPIGNTAWGPVLGVEVLAGGLPAWAVRMPNSDRGPLFTELLATARLRDALSLENGDRIPLRLLTGS